MTELTPADVLGLVTDGKLTLLDRPSWLDDRAIEDLHAANAGCSNAAMRLAPVLAAEWIWRLGYDNLAELAWRQDDTVTMRVISLSPAHALLVALLQALVMGPEGVRGQKSHDARRNENFSYGERVGADVAKEFADRKGCAEKD